MTNPSNIVALAAATVFLAACLGCVVWHGLVALRRIGAFFLIFAVGMVYYGGSKGFYRNVQFPRTDMNVAYLTDAGSYVSNDCVRVKFNASPALPEDAEIWLDYRDGESTNDADWVTYTNATLATFPNPLDFDFPNAISNVWMCYTDWTPGAAVTTNGVIQIQWHLPASETNNPPRKIAIIHTSINHRRKDEN